jgi:hypothetical protein
MSILIFPFFSVRDEITTPRRFGNPSVMPKHGPIKCSYYRKQNARLVVLTLENMNFQLLHKQGSPQNPRKLAFGWQSDWPWRQWEGASYDSLGVPKTLNL